MNLFLNITHSELDDQMKERSQLHSNDNSVHNIQHLDLLVELLEIKNELTSLENFSLELFKGTFKYKNT